MQTHSILQNHHSLLSAEQNDLAQLLIECDQDHLFQHWPSPGEEDELKISQMEQLLDMHRHYPGGLKVYYNNALKLLDDSRKQSNSFANYSPAIPHGTSLDFKSTTFDDYEYAGLKSAHECAFVLVAGGLGERLGYSDIKIALPSELVSEKTFLELYMQYIHALELNYTKNSHQEVKIPLAIMTSDDTHPATQKLLADNDYYRLTRDQVTLLKQEKVPALKNNQAHFAQNPDDLYLIQAKPHGHGDVHSLLHQSGLASTWLKEGKKWVFFFQDTNALAINAFMAMLGVSLNQQAHLNSLVVPRKAGEAAGGLARLEHKENGRALTINVEYNQLDPLLKANGCPEGDTPDENGFSPYPGNINVLLFNLKAYCSTLERSGGAVPEFVNPKYADEQREQFKKPTRLECMMQDYPKLLDADDSVTFTLLDREFCFSAVKNNCEDALKKSQIGLPPECAASGEMDIYHAQRIKCHSPGQEVSPTETSTIGGIPFDTGPRLVLSPEFAILKNDLQCKLKNIHIKPHSTLWIEGEDIHIDGLELDGTLTIHVEKGGKLTLKNCSVNNDGWPLVLLKPDEKAPEFLKIRQFKIDKINEKRIVVKEGEHLKLENQTFK